MLLSGNGRHRKPRQAPTAVVAVAATGAGMALPLLGAGTAHAASGTVWDAVAQCESGGQWSSNSGNGFFGGLQISQGTWDEYGGRRYAPRPDLASITQQTEVANAILAALGPDAWPGCADKAGLRQGDSASPVPTGPSLGDLLNPARSGSDASGPVAAPPPEATAPSASSSGSSAPASHPASASATPPAGQASSGGSSGAAAPSSGSASSSSSSSPSASSSSSSSSSLPSAASSTATSSGAAGAPASGFAADGSEPVAESAWGVLVPDDLPGRGSVSSGATERAVTYRVRPGDSLCAIAVEHGVSWRDLYHENKAKIGNDPNVIHPGQYLTVGH